MVYPGDLPGELMKFVGMSNFDTSTRFSESSITDRMVAFAQRVGMPYSISEGNWFRYCNADTFRLDDPDIVALDEFFGPNWLALVMDNDEQLRTLTSELDGLQKRYAIQWTDNQTLVIVDLVDCPAEWINHQV